MAGEAERIRDLYERHARAWDKDRSRSLFEKAWLDKFLSLMPPDPRVLDIGCGSGEPIGQYLIQQGCKITGVDSAPSLIDLCRQRFPGQNWMVGDMRELLLDDHFDGILAWDSFFHLTPEDQQNMFSVFSRHAGPSTVLMFTSGPTRGQVIGDYRGEPLYHASLNESEFRSLLNDINFDVVEHVVEDPDCTNHTIWLAQQR